MSLILNIDTSTEIASISLAENDRCLSLLSNSGQKEHASWLHVAIQKGLTDAGRRIEDVNAVGITAGPGSYTGLRIGMAAAKGLCFALDIPLIAISTLEAMASVGVHEDVDYICPMIDARRMEVFTALYTRELIVVLPPRAMTLDANTFSDYLENKKLLFYGSGSIKFSGLIGTPNAVFKDIVFNAAHLAPLSFSRFVNRQFSPLAYLEPVYLKEYYSLSDKS